MIDSVVVVNDRAFPGGGASTVALASARGLAARGTPVTLLAAMGPADPSLEAAGVRVELLGQADLATGARAGMAAQGLWNGAAAARLAEVLRAQPAGRTIVHVHSWSKALSPSVFHAIRRSGHAAVATLHDYGFVCPNAALHDFPTGKPCLRRPMSVSCLTRNCDSRRYVHKLWRVGRQLSLERVARAADSIDAAVCVTDFARDIYAPLLPPGLKTVVVANPIDVADLGPADPAAQSRFVYAGRLSREKGVLLLAEAARRAAVPLVVVGDGELAAEVLAINPQVEITGWLPREAVTGHMRRARAVALPAEWRETQGMVAPEAFANGVPFIASSGTAPGAAVDDGQTGRLFANGDVEGLAAVLRDLARDDDAVRRMGRLAYDRYWAAPPTLDRHLDALEDLYRAVLEDRAAGHTGRAA
jgi:glycosyltransferase involved in cell wall biosynthesis